MASLNDTDGLNSSDDVMDTNHGDKVPTLDEAINIFAEYNVLNGIDGEMISALVNCDEDSISELSDCIIDNDNDIEKRGKHLRANNLKERDLPDPNYNLVNTRDRPSHLSSWRKSTSGYKPAIPVIVEDTTKQQVQQGVRPDHAVIDKETSLVAETRCKSDLHFLDDVVDRREGEASFGTTSTTNNDTLLTEDGLDEKTILFKQQTMVRRRRHSVENVRTKKLVDITTHIKDMPSRKDSTHNEINTLNVGENDDDTHKVETNNNQGDLLNLISSQDKSNQPESSESNATPISLPGTPRNLNPPCPLPGRSRRPRRYSLADVSNMSLSVLEDKSFAREIRQHQVSLRDRTIGEPIIESNHEGGENDDVRDGKVDSSTSGDLTSPRERAKYLQRRRASHGTIAPILPILHLPRSPRSSVVYSAAAETSSQTITTLDSAIALQDDEGEVLSSHAEAKDDSTLSEMENKDRLDACRRNKRRSSWACTGAHSNIKPISTMDLLRQSTFSHENKLGTPASCDPYHVTVHFISDPGQADWLRNFLRPITSAIVPAHFAIFNYAERSVHVRMPELEDEDHTKIPALAIVVFIQEELGAERLENAQGLLKKEPWALHHRSELGPTAVPYPTNNQDYYAHANSMPLWAVRQVHCGSDRLRCQLFVSDEHWSSSIELYTTILGHGVQYQKEDFCFFNVYSDTTRNLEIQLSLKRLPTGYNPLPMEDVILQFKIADMGSLVPLLPNVCSPISDKRWQTTDFDGNKILLLRGSEKAGKYTPRMDTSHCAGVSKERSRSSAEGGESTAPSDNERARMSRQKNRRHKHGPHNLTTAV